MFILCCSLNVLGLQWVQRGTLHQSMRPSSCYNWISGMLIIKSLTSLSLKRNITLRNLPSSTKALFVWDAKVLQADGHKKIKIKVIIGARFYFWDRMIYCHWKQETVTHLGVQQF